MRDQALFDKIDLHLIRVLHTVLTERSVSKAAMKLGMYQPAVSASLKRLRELAGDPLVVRSGAGMVPTDAGLRMIEPSASILRAAEMLFSEARGFDPQTATTTFRVAAADYLDPLFLPELVARVKAQAPRSQIEIHPLSADSDYHLRLAEGQVDVVGATGSSRRKTCTSASCLPTRSSAWSPATIRPPSAAGPPRAGWKPNTSPPPPPTPAPEASSTTTWKAWACGATSPPAARISG